MKKATQLILLILLTFGLNSVSFADNDEKKLFVSLISDDLDRAAMAVSISKKALSGEIPATIFLSAQGVRWADKSIPQNKYVNGKTIPQMLQEFMKSGGQVIICKMCMENVGGMNKKDVIDGVKMEGTLNALFADNTTVLTY
jgi:predicted peroxiredoxin